MKGGDKRQNLGEGYWLKNLFSYKIEYSKIELLLIKIIKVNTKRKNNLEKRIENVHQNVAKRIKRKK